MRVGLAVGTVTWVTAEASRLESLPDHSAALVPWVGTLVTLVHFNGSGASVLSPANDSDLSFFPLSAFPLAFTSRT